MRLFIAIALERGAGAALLHVCQRLAAPDDALRWSRPADRHITLQFLGEVSPERAARVVEHLAAVRSPRVPVRIAGLGFFARPGVFWAGVDPSPELLALHQEVTAATRACGFLAEPRPYRPHITLARTRGRTGAASLAALRHTVERSRIRLAADFISAEFSLFESFPGPEGSRYEVRASFPLGEP